LPTPGKKAQARRVVARRRDGCREGARPRVARLGHPSVGGKRRLTGPGRHVGGRCVWDAGSTSSGRSFPCSPTRRCTDVVQRRASSRLCVNSGNELRNRASALGKPSGATCRRPGACGGVVKGRVIPRPREGVRRCRRRARRKPSVGQEALRREFVFGDRDVLVATTDGRVVLLSSKTAPVRRAR
jgi:hypothetical protein